ncbi:hypothetical protein M3J09_005053 [Ascochyta lentis]
MENRKIWGESSILASEFLAYIAAWSRSKSRGNQPEVGLQNRLLDHLL